MNGIFVFKLIHILYKTNPYDVLVKIVIYLPTDSLKM